MSERVLALVGAGHAHLYLLRQAASYRAAGVRVVLIDPGDFWYSGLATGMLAGRNEADDDRIDIAALCRACGVERMAARVTRIDVPQSLLELEHGSSLRFDRLSLNLGSVVSMPPWADASRCWTVKPIPQLLELRERLRETMRRERRCPPVVVAGGGVTGLEVAAAITALAQREHCAPRVTLAGRDSVLGAQLPPPARAALLRHLQGRGVTCEARTQLVAQDAEAVTDDRGRRHACSELVVATGLHAHPLTQTLGLAADPEGGLHVDATLRSAVHPHIFATGDCAHFLPRPLPKVGVYGVRAAPVLHRNLLASFAGEALRDYSPQKRYLAILNLGDGRGLAVLDRLWWMGGVSQRLKDSIDRRFMSRCRYAPQRD